MPTFEQKKQALEYMRNGDKRGALAVLRGESTGEQGGSAEASPMGDSQQYSEPIGPRGPTHLEEPANGEGPPAMIDNPPDIAPGGFMDIVKRLSQTPKMLIDSAVTGQDPGVLRDKMLRDDGYVPGASMQDKFVGPGNGIDKRVSRLAFDVGTDPLTFLPMGSKAAGPIADGLEAQMAAGMSKRLPDVIMEAIKNGTMKGTQAAAQIATGGRFGDKWAESFLKVKPLDQMFPGSALEKAQEAYNPLKGAAREVMAGRASAIDEGFAPVASNAGDDISNAIMAAEQKANDVIAEFTRANKPIPQDLQGLKDRLTSIISRGQTHGAEAGEVLDTLNDLGWTPMGNSRSVKASLKAVTGKTRGAMNEVANASHPEFAQAKDSLHNILNVNPPLEKSGGKVSRFIMQNMLPVAGMATGTKQMVEGNFSGGAGTMAAAFLLHNPSAWNFFIGATRLAPELAGAGLKPLAMALETHPELMKVAILAMTHQDQAGIAPEQMQPQLPMEPQPMDQGQAAMPPPTPQSQPLIGQPPLAPPIAPQDAMLMQQTGLQSIQGGKIMDPMEREKFTNDVMSNEALSPEQKSKIRLHLNATGGGVLTPDML